jgi:predicted Rossmann fold flavoprotein
VSESPVTVVQRLLRSWPLRAQREFFERDVGVPLALEDESRKWFPASNRARDVRDGLVALARRKGVEFRFNTPVLDLDPSAAGWRVRTPAGELSASAVVLATGGLSVPATGSSGDGLVIARRLSHAVHDPYPALTPLLADSVAHSRLSGVSAPVEIRAESSGVSAVARGGFLFTHRGYSGPAVLDISHVPVRLRADAERARVLVNWAGRTVDDWRRDLVDSTGQVATVIGRYVPRRLAEQLTDESGIPSDRRAADLRRDERLRIVNLLTNYPLPWTGDEGYRKAEVTGGGVALEELNVRTLESRRHPRLFLCGELLDAFGPIGGHNFAWAWATGRMAGLGARGHDGIKLEV